VVLFVFLRHFNFSTTDGSVQWKMAGIIAVPTVDEKVQLPTTHDHRECEGMRKIVSSFPVNL
jgi:hypothetical protein